MKPTILLRPLHHRGGEQIAIDAPQDAALTLAIRKLPGARWSGTHRLWYVPMNQESYDALLRALKPLATLDVKALRAYIEKRKQVAATRVAPASPQPNGQDAAWRLCPENRAALQRYVEHLKLKAYSLSTQKTYRSEFVQLLLILKAKPVDSLETDDLRRYFLYCLEKLKLTEATLHSRINAVKFYFEQVLGRERFFWEIPRPKRAEKLPRFFNKEEVAAIINHISNVKHKAMLMLAYGCGLRVSEIVNLKTRNVDSKRMCIIVENAKGKKDRMVGLSPVLLVMLRNYAGLHKPAKDGYLFEGSVKGQPYAARSLQEVLQAAKIRAGILKPGGVHGLRHSFATHLVDRGTDVTMIQKLLGHVDIKTTLRYLHTTNKDLLHVISPLDDLELL